MDTCRLRYIGKAPVLVAPLGRAVTPDELVEFPGQIVEPKDQPDDAVYTEAGNPPTLRAWPKSQWRNETVVKPRKVEEK